MNQGGGRKACLFLVSDDFFIENKMTFQSIGSLLTCQLISRLGDAISLLSKEKRVCVIAYHRILEHPDPLLASEPDIAAFTWQMESLAANFNVMPLHDALIAMRDGSLPPRAVCITFDDGYRSTHDIALPILKRLGLSATVFVTTGFLDAGSMWNDRIVDAVRTLPEGTVDLSPLGMGSRTLEDGGARTKLLREIDEKCKYMHNEGRLAIISVLEKIAGQVPRSSEMLTREMVANLALEGMEIGGHTVTHPILTKLADESAYHEIYENKRVLEEITGKTLRLFAYPNGKVGMDFDGRHVKMIADLGYRAAFTTALGAVSKSSDIYQLPRRRPWDQSPFRFCVRLLSWLATGERKPTGPVQTSGVKHDEIIQTNHNVLLVAYHYPPQAESSGVQRTLSFSKYLHNDGWTPCVLSAHPVAYERKNNSQLAQIPSDITVKRAWALDSKRHLGLFGRYPELIALPDRWVSWLFSAVPLGLSMVREKRVDVIWTTYPIATAHLIGLTLKRLTKLPWVADFRDPMTQVDYPERKWQRAVFRWIERKTIRNCDAAVFTTYSACETYKLRYPKEKPEKFHVIENGYDEDGFKGIGEGLNTSPVLPGNRITLLHSGVLYSAGRDPSAFFAAISSMKQRGQVTGDSLRVILRAPGEEEYFSTLIQQHQISDIVFVEPSIPYHQALREMLSADGLLLFQGTPFNTQIPAKIYEYFRAKKPIFGLLDPNGETATVLCKAGFHNIAEIDSAASICSALECFIHQIRTGQVKIASEELITASSRKYRARQLASILGPLVHPLREVHSS